ncbi:MAG: hypothetical protein ACR2KG_05355 [Nocardioidaceae bacterium]
MPSVDGFDFAAFGPRSRPDMRIVAGLVEQLRARPERLGLERVALRQPTDTTFYPQYVGELEHLFVRAPIYAEVTRVEDRGDLAGALQAGQLFEVLVDGQWAGLVATPRKRAYGVRGFWVQEMLLCGRVRGQGLGPAVQQRLLAELPAHQGDALFGSIEERNGPSLGSAYATGRVDVAVHAWLTPKRADTRVCCRGS